MKVRPDILTNPNPASVRARKEAKERGKGKAGCGQIAWVSHYHYMRAGAKPRCDGPTSRSKNVDSQSEGEEEENRNGT